MDHLEAQSRAFIASALIGSGAVTVPRAGSQLTHTEGVRLRELTDHVYRLITSDCPSLSDMPASPRRTAE